MKTFLLPLTILVLTGAIATACSPSDSDTATSTLTPNPPQELPTSSPTISPMPSPSALIIGDFTIDELFAAGGGGCGMTLWTPERVNMPPGDRRFVFFNGISDDSMLMNLDGNLVRFNRSDASGAEFYGQRTSQTFVSRDRRLVVTVDVELGDPGEIESVGIRAGTIRVEQDGAVVEIPVIGDAGC